VLRTISDYCQKSAFKYSRPAAQVHLLVRADESLLIQVTDTGMRIAPEDLPHIWEELYRAHPATKIAGSGVGLAMVWAIVARHDDAVQVESKPEHGTTISLQLPALLQTHVTQASTESSVAQPSCSSEACLGTA